MSKIFCSSILLALLYPKPSIEFWSSVVIKYCQSSILKLLEGVLVLQYLRVSDHGRFQPFIFSNGIIVVKNKLRGAICSQIVRVVRYVRKNVVITIVKILSEREFLFYDLFSLILLNHQKIV